MSDVYPPINEGRPWFEGHDWLGRPIKFSEPAWSSGPDIHPLVDKVIELEKRIAKLESKQYRKPKRKANRR